MHGYLYFNGQKLPDPDSYQVNIDDITQENETEAGTTQVIMVRREQYEIDVSFTVKSKWLKELSQYRNMDEINVRFYDPGKDGSETRIMRIRGYKPSLMKESENINRTNGIWEVGFTLEEF